MFYNILDKKRLEILPLFKNFKSNFYLAGGTALALQLGHRDSVDFDFFRKKDIDTKVLFEKIEQVFEQNKVSKTQESNNTLSVIIDQNIKLSFFSYKYPLIDKIIETDSLELASITDIGCMKLSAITSRATLKDYIDLHFILQKIRLPDLLAKADKKFPNIDINLFLKSLVYFEDLQNEKIKFKNNNHINLKELKKSLEFTVKKYFRH